MHKFCTFKDLSITTAMLSRSGRYNTHYFPSFNLFKHFWGNTSPTLLVESHFFLLGGVETLDVFYIILAGGDVFAVLTPDEFFHRGCVNLHYGAACQCIGTLQLIGLRVKNN